MTDNNSRRRGDALIQDIFRVTYNLLQTESFTELTFTRVAKDAHTSRSVLYRYWDTPFELALAAVHDKTQSANQLIERPQFDNGSLRADLLFIGQHFTRWLQSIPVEFNRLILSEMASQEKQVQQLLNSANQYSLKLMHHVLTLAVSRREIKEVTQVPISTQLVLFQLIRYQFVVANKSITYQDITDWVDSIVLPAILKLTA